MKLRSIGAAASLALCQLWGCATAVPPVFAPQEIERSGGVEVVPLTRIGDHSFVSAEIDGRGPYELVVDTGAGAVILSHSVAHELGWRPQAESRPSPPGHGVPAEVWRIGSLRVGEVVFREFDALVVDLERIERHFGRPIGLLGFSVLASQPFELRLADGELLFRDHPDEVLAGWVPYRVNQWGVPQVQVTLAGLAVWMDIDSGSDAAMILRVSEASQLPFRRGPREGLYAITLFGRVVEQRGEVDGAARFGGVEISNPQVVIKDSPTPPSIGGSLLEQFRIAFDVQGQRVAFEPLTEGAMKVELGRTIGAGFDLAGDPWAIDAIAAGLGAEAAGLREGDLILSVDGVAVGSIGPTEWVTLLRESEQIELEIARDGERLQVSVPVTPWFPDEEEEASTSATLKGSEWSLSSVLRLSSREVPSVDPPRPPLELRLSPRPPESLNPVQGRMPDVHDRIGFSCQKGFEDLCYFATPGRVIWRGPPL